MVAGEAAVLAENREASPPRRCASSACTARVRPRRYSSSGSSGSSSAARGTESRSSFSSTVPLSCRASWATTSLRARGTMATRRARTTRLRRARGGGAPPTASSARGRAAAAMAFRSAGDEFAGLRSRCSPVRPQGPRPRVVASSAVARAAARRCRRFIARAVATRLFGERERGTIRDSARWHPHDGGHSVPQRAPLSSSSAFCARSSGSCSHRRRPSRRRRR